MRYLQCYTFDAVSGQLLGVDIADEDPLVEGNFLLPAHATFIEPPEPIEGKWRRFDGTAWVYEDVPEEPPPTAPPPPSADAIRAERNMLLSESDWTQLPDVPEWVTTNLAAWRTYRQALRDIPQQGGFPATVDWPEKP